jgi:spore maturation protein SpmB
MCTFLAINTSSIQLIPATTVALLAAAGSKNPTAIIGTAFFATCCSTLAGILSVKALERLPIYSLPPSEKPFCDSTNEPVTIEEKFAAPKWWGNLVLLAFAACFLLFGWNFIAASHESKSLLVSVVEAVSYLAIPFLIAFFPLYAALCRVPVYEEFIEGAKEGFQVSVRIIPYLVAIIAAVAMFRAAGGLDMIARAVGPILSAIQLPTELLPLVLMRPLSGSGSNAIFAELLQSQGPDSLTAKMGATVLGSTETTFYVIAVYFGSVAVRRSRHAVPAGLIADLAGVIASILICRLVFGN